MTNKDDPASLRERLENQRAAMLRLSQQPDRVVSSAAGALAMSVICAETDKIAADAIASLEAERAGGREAVAWLCEYEQQNGGRRKIAFTDYASVRKCPPDFGDPVPLYAAAPAQPTGWRPIGDTPKAGGAGADIPTTPEPPK